MIRADRVDVTSVTSRTREQAAEGDQSGSSRCGLVYVDPVPQRFLRSNHAQVALNPLRGAAELGRER
jgi:hypothetical protein